MSKLWISETRSIELEAQARTPLAQEFATRDRSIDYSAMFAYLPNPDPILKKLGQDIQVYRDLEVDAHVGACLLQRRSGTLSQLWEIDRGESKSRTAKFIQAIFEKLPMQRIIEEMIEGPLYGYKVLEIMWGVRDNAWVPVDIVGKPQEWFNFDGNGNLQFKTKSNPMGIAVPENKFLLSRSGASQFNPYGKPDLAKVFWPVFFKKGGIKFWAVACEKFGMPFILGKHNDGEDKTVITAMLDMLSNMVQDGVAVIPKSAEVEMLERKASSNAGESYKGLVEICNSEISKGLVGQTLTTELPDGGSYAAAKEHGGIRNDITEMDTRIVCETINHLINIVIDYNFGPNAERPKFIMYEEEEIDYELAKRDQQLSVPLQASGLRLTKSYYQRAYGLQDDEIESAPAAPVGKFDRTPPTEPNSELASPQEPTGQSQVDSMVDQLEQAAPAADLLAPVESLLSECSTLEELRDRLIDTYSQMEPRRLGTLLEKTMLAAELSGRFDISTEAANA